MLSPPTIAGRGIVC